MVFQWSDTMLTNWCLIYCLDTHHPCTYFSKVFFFPILSTLFLTNFFCSLWPTRHSLCSQILSHHPQTDFLNWEFINTIFGLWLFTVHDLRISFKILCCSEASERPILEVPNYLNLFEYGLFKINLTMFRIHYH